MQEYFTDMNNPLKNMVKGRGWNTKIVLSIAGFGLLLFVLISSTFSFKDKLFGSLFPKPPSRAAYVFDDDFESGKLVAPGGKWDSQRVEVGGSLIATSSAAASGSYGLDVTSNAGSDRAYLRKSITSTPELYARVKMKITRDIPVSPVGAYQGFISMTDVPDSNSLATLALRTTAQVTNRLYIMYKNDSTAIDTGVSITPDTWYCVEMRTIVSQAAGSVQVWVNGNLVKDAQNINTGNTAISWLRLGTGGIGGPTEYYFDDYVTNDTNQIGCGIVLGKIGPIRSNASPSGQLPGGTTQVTMTLNTEVASTCKYDNKVGTDFASMPDTFSITGGTTHSTVITGISPGNSYSYYARCDGGAKGINDDDFRIAFRSGILETTLKPLILTSTYESVSVRSPWGDDENSNNQAVLQWRKTGEVGWKDGMAMSVDRRPVIIANWGGGTSANPYRNEWRASVLGLIPDTDYQIQVSFTDPDGVTGTNPVMDTIRTRSENFPSNGQSYFVSPSGLDTNPGTESQPFQTIQKAVSVTNAGDTVLVKAGTYTGRVDITKSGNAGAYITIKNYGSDKPVLDGTNNPNLCSPVGGYWGGFTCAIYIQGNYIRISGFEIVNVNNGITVGKPSHDVVLEKNLIHELVWLTNPSVSIIIGDDFHTLSDISNITIQDNEVHSNHPPPNIFTSVSPITFVAVRGGMVVRRNKIIYEVVGSGLHGSDCIDTQGDAAFAGWVDSDVYDNYCQGTTDDGIEMDGADLNLRVWNNTILHSNTCFSTAPSVVGPAYIFRNVCFEGENHWVGTVISNKIAQSGTGDTFFYHNTINLAYNGDVNQALAYTGVVKSVTVTSGGSGYTSAPTVTFSGGGGLGATGIANVSDGQVTGVNIPKGGYRPYTSAPIVSFSGGGGSGAAATATIAPGASGVADFGSGEADQNEVFKNNIFHVWSRPVSISRLNEKPTMDYDIFATEEAFFVKWAGAPYGKFSSFQAASGQEAHGINAKPAYVNAANGDFHLAPGSEGIDKGTVLVGFNDASSKWAYSGSAPDIGAYEAGGFGGPVVVPPTTPAVVLPTSSSTPTPMPSPEPSNTITSTLSPTPAILSPSTSTVSIPATPTPAEIASHKSVIDLIRERVNNFNLPAKNNLQTDQTSPSIDSYSYTEEQVSPALQNKDCGGLCNFVSKVNSGVENGFTKIFVFLLRLAGLLRG